VPTGTANRGALDPEVTRSPAFVVHPRDFDQIEEGIPYTVPAGKLFMLTALGSSGSSPYQNNMARSYVDSR
jgi:hypothetical protein